MCYSDLLSMFVMVGTMGAAIVAAMLVIRWVIAHTDIGTRDYSRLDPDEMVTVAAFSHYLEAELWRGRLNAAGVSCMITGSISANFFRYPSLFGPRIRLQVLARDARRALRVLEPR